MAEHVGVDLLGQLLALAQQDALALSDLLQGHLLALGGQDLEELVPGDFGVGAPALGVLLVGGAQFGEGVDDVLFADAVDWPAVDEQPEKQVQVQLVDRLLVVFDVLGEPDFILHVLDLLLSGVEAHAAHHVSDGLQGNLAVQLPSFGCVLVL